MTKSQKAKHEWILETQMFQRIAKTGEDTYEHLAEYYDAEFKNLSVREKQTLAENAKIQTQILKLTKD